MTDRDDTDARPAETREARLSAALRANLRRRKAQSRARVGVEASPRRDGEAPAPSPRDD